MPTPLPITVHNPGLTTPSIQPTTWLDDLRDTWDQSLKGFPPADIARALLGDSQHPQVPIPLATSFPGGVASEMSADEMRKLVQSFVKQYKGIPLRGEAVGDLASTLTPTRLQGVHELKDPVMERLEHLGQIGRDIPMQSNWKGSVDPELHQAFDSPKSADQYARIWAALSPKTMVPNNTRESVLAWLHNLERPGQGFALDAKRQFIPYPEMGPQGMVTMAGSKVPNLNNALAELPLSGDKVNGMDRFMRGEDMPPIDVHTIYNMSGAKGKLDAHIPALRDYFIKTEGLPAKGALSDTDIYNRTAGALRTGLTDIMPEQSFNQTFGETWEGGRAHKGLLPQGSPTDILRAKGLLEPGAMMDPQRLRQALKTPGWTALGGLAALAAKYPTIFSTMGGSQEQ